VHNPLLHRLLAQARTEELCRDARAARAARRPLPVRRSPVDEWVTLRFAFPDDALALARLAALDSASAPAEPVLVADVGGELRVALSLSDGRLVADPFHRSGPLVELLRARARQLEGGGAAGRRRAWLRGRLGLAAWR
jgi:hypothetical protein